MNDKEKQTQHINSSVTTVVTDHEKVSDVIFSVYQIYKHNVSASFVDVEYKQLNLPPIIMKSAVIRFVVVQKDE